MRSVRGKELAMFGIHNHRCSTETTVSNPARPALLETLENRQLMSGTPFHPWLDHALPYEGSGASHAVNMIRRSHVGGASIAQLSKASASETLNATPVFASKAIARTIRHTFVKMDSVD
jgi:hypothetical protein